MKEFEFTGLQPHDTPPEVQRIGKLFNYLHPREDAKPSMVEWTEALRCICWEVRLCMSEFLQFIGRAFHMDLKAAWDVMDEGRDGEIKEVDWRGSCRRLGFYGSHKLIFKYLDAE